MRNGYWLEMKIQIKGPLLEIKREFQDKICRVTPYIQPEPGEEDGMDLVSIVLRDKSGLLRVKQFIQTRYEPKSTMEYVRCSESLKGDGKVIFYSWVKSPSFNLIRKCLLQGYELHHSVEHFVVYHMDKGFLLGEVLRKVFEKSRAKMDWMIRESIISSHYPGLTFFQNYKYRMALENNFFEKYDKELLSPLAKDIRTVTGKKYDKEKLAAELKDIQKKVFDYLASELSK